MRVKTKQQSKTPSKAELMKTVKLPSEIKFDEAVKMGKTFVANINLNEWELGALADRVKPDYGLKTLAKLAEKINFPLDRLNRCRSTYRAYKGADFEGTTPNFGAAQALQSHPERVSILKAEPDLPVREARGIARAAKGRSRRRSRGMMLVLYAQPSN